MAHFLKHSQNINQIKDSKQKAVVLKLGGSVLFNPKGLMKQDLLQDLIDVVHNLHNKEKQIFLCVGGGTKTRQLVNHFKNAVPNKSILDHLSILTTTYHSQIILTILNMKFKTEMITDYSQLLMASRKEVVYVLGGMFPGQSTNAVAAMCAEFINAEYLFNLFNYDYIMDSDPEIRSKGSELKTINYRHFEKLIMHFKQQPGNYELFDRNALKFIQRSEISTVFINGNYPHRILDWYAGKAVGTLISKEDF